ncbi:unnamed protein product [Ceratitis capitata]|uniref:(Mediterranean fruit fly) hypothetical protein n=1 Tax=Ceratitis capitata TaxID=7213 RepID=A0A811V6V2_CERCA|nr:unnamed protein product [Ceratitis capitata]
MSDLKTFESMRLNATQEYAEAELENATAAAAGMHCDDVSSLHEISVIENMTSFLLEHGGGDVDSKVLRTIAEALSKRVHDSVRFFFAIL